MSPEPFTVQPSDSHHHDAAEALQRSTARWRIATDRNVCRTNKRSPVPNRSRRADPEASTIRERYCLVKRISNIFQRRLRVGENAVMMDGDNANGCLPNFFICFHAAIVSRKFVRMR